MCHPLILWKVIFPNPNNFPQIFTFPDMTVLSNWISHRAVTYPDRRLKREITPMQASNFGTEDISVRLHLLPDSHTSRMWLPFPLSKAKDLWPITWRSPHPDVAHQAIHGDPKLELRLGGGEESSSLLVLPALVTKLVTHRREARSWQEGIQVIPYYGIQPGEQHQDCGSSR